ncbi:MAG: DNA/RNA nuclease SfsA [Thermodesulfobacteriota bacterium]
MPTRKALFLARPNRFMITCMDGGNTLNAFLPNPGRLQELLLPGAVVYLEEARGENRRLAYTAVAVERDGRPVVLHTHRANEVVGRLLQENAIPGLEGAEVVRGEVKRGNSRFDFLLRRKRTEILLEVKSCTLFSRHAALFPDAVTTRGRKHVEELRVLAGEGMRCAVLFLIHSPLPAVFLPEYHVDPEFAESLYAARENISLYPVSVEWRKDLSINLNAVKVLPIPWEAVEGETGDSGAYLLVLELRRKRVIETGGLGKVAFEKGLYVYVGSAKKGLSARLQRHRRLRKKPFWHVDYLRAETKIHGVFPIRTKDDLECTLAGELRRMCEWEIPGFGSSDCGCPSHLFGFSTDPLATSAFHNLVLFYRADRLIRKCSIPVR